MQHMMDVGAHVMRKSTIICSGTVMFDQLYIILTLWNQMYNHRVR